MLSKKRMLIALFVVLAVVFQLITPITARAQEETPPTEVPSTEVPVDPGTGEGEIQAVEEILEQVPDGTAIVVVNEAGTPEPLATQTAGEIISGSDPVWCEEPYTPADDPTGALGYCTPSFSYVSQVTDYMTDNDLSGSGTLFFQAGVYVAGPGDFDYGVISIDDDSLFDNLTIWGGWDLNAASPAYGTHVSGGTTTFTDPFGVYLPMDVTIIDVVVDGAIHEGNASLGVYAGGDLVLDNVSVLDNTAGGGASVYSDGGDVTITGGNFTGNDGDGIQILDFGGDVTVTGGNYSGNQDAGMWVRVARGNVTITGGNYNDNQGEETGYGLLIDGVMGDVLIDGATASGNGYEGIEVYSDYGGDVTLNGVLASGSETGAWIWAAGGNVEVTNSLFTGNTDNGLYIRRESPSAGPAFGMAGQEVFLPTAGVTLSNVDVVGNGSGASIRTDGNVTISDSVFSDNGWLTSESIGLDIYLFGPGNVSLTNVDVSGNNGEGMVVSSEYSLPVSPDEPLPPAGETYLPGNTVTILCSSFNDNASAGIVLTGALTASLTNVTAVGNGTDPIVTEDGATFTEQTLGSCYPVPVTPPPAPPALPLHYIQVGTGEPVELDCVHYSGTVLVMPNGDKAIYLCSATGSANAKSLAAGELPGALGSGQSYVSAIEIGLENGGEVEILPDGSIKVAFQVPAGVDPASLAILYWDPAQNAWVELPADALYDSLYDPSDGKIVMVGPHVGDAGRFEATVNFTGTFVLVQK